MKPTPCSVCGGTDLNLIDGFYYCVECGTQDVNAQETIVESTMLGDGTFAQAARRKIKTILKDAVEMSGEWHRWHAFNFILTSLVEELVALGARPSVKMKVLWIWQRYIQKFQERDDNCSDKKLPFEEILDTTLVYEETDKKFKGYKIKAEANQRKKNRELEMKAAVNDIKVLSKGVLLAILYVALNLDKSEIQLYHLIKFVKDGLLSILSCEKFVPKEIETKSIPDWERFYRCKMCASPYLVRQIALSLFRALNLGTPLIPDLRKLIDSYARELCLPNDLKGLIFSLMKLVPPDYAYVHPHAKKGLVRLPDFEGVAMSYVIVAFKMCFGLDNDYEIKLSNAVDKVNAEENRLKCYKIGFIDQTDRLFSFREWCNYLMFRKTLLCKYYLPLADKYGLEVDDCILLEQSEDRQRRKKDLSDEVTMDLLHKIAFNDPVDVIAKKKFPMTLTPMSTYTEVIANHIENQETKLLLSEDFTLYSLKYACGGELLPIDEAESFLTGTSEENKIINKNIVGNISCKNLDLDLVYVKNCENKNWLKTKPPRKPHITVMNNDNVDDADDDENQDHVNETKDYISNSDSSDEEESKDEINEIRNFLDSKDELNLTKNNNESKNNISHLDNETSNDTKIESHMSDYGYDSNLDSVTEVQTKSDITISSTEMIANRKLETIKEEDINRSIFDDTFADLNNDNVSDQVSYSSRLVFENETPIDQFETHSNFNGTQDNLNDTQSTTDSGLETPHFDPRTFNRSNVIKELIVSACRKYKINVPTEFRDSIKERKKRKRKDDAANVDNEKPKRPRLGTGKYRCEIDKILVDYYTALQTDVINQVSEQVRSAVRNIEIRNIHSINNTRLHDMPDSDIPTDLQNNDEIGQGMDENNEENIENITENNENLNTETDEDEEDVDDLLSKVLPKSDPKFDEKEYDTRQLYLRFKSKFRPDILFDFEDPTLLEIIEKQLEGRRRRICFSNISTDEQEKPSTENENDDTKNSEENTSEVEEAKIMNEIQKQSEEKLDPMIANVTLYKNYKYWIRHYGTNDIKKSMYKKQRFDSELQEHFSSSFNFVIQECAAILDYSAYTLYQHVQSLEEKLIAKT